MKNKITLLISIFLFTSFSYSQKIDNSEIETKLDSLLTSKINHKGKNPVHNLIIYTSDANDFKYFKGFGIIGRDETPVENNFQFKIASISKTFVSTVILQLVEEEKLSLSDSVYTILSEIDYLNIENFHILNGFNYSKNITVEQLLRHRSGLADIFSDKETRFFLSLLLNKQKQYSPRELVKKYFKYKLNKSAVFQPDEDVHYSDMNFLLLGLIIEEITKESLSQNIRTRILEPLNMKNTYYEYYESITGIDRQIDLYLGKLNITEKINTSYDWGGGGHVSTVQDLAIFIKAIFDLQLFKNHSTLDTMLELTPIDKYADETGLGIFYYKINGNNYYGHGGFYGSLLLHSPKTKITISIISGQASNGYHPQGYINEIEKIIVNN